MARTVVMAQDGYQHPDVDYRLANNSKKGYVIQSFEDGANLGKKVTLPKFVIIETPGVKLSAVRRYERWPIRQLDFVVVGNNLSQDGWRMDVLTTNAALGGAGKLTRTMVDNFLSGWNAVSVSIASTGVRFDVAVYAAAISPAMWGTPPVVFSEDAYDQTTGVHQIRATYNNAPVPQSVMTKAEAIVSGNGGIVVSSDPGSLVFDISRATVFDKFKKDVRAKLETRFIKRHYYFDPAVVDQAIANGGTLTMTGAEAVTAIRDLLAE